MALIGPVVTVALKAQGLFFHWGLYLIVAGILIRITRSHEAAESFLTTEHSLAVSELQSWHAQNRKIPKNKWLCFCLCFRFPPVRMMEFLAENTAGIL